MEPDKFGLQAGALTCAAARGLGLQAAWESFNLRSGCASSRVQRSAATPEDS
jgi:hypothetical protein